jgi:hypothetical protein
MSIIERMFSGKISEFYLEVSYKASWRRWREVNKHLTSEHGGGGRRRGHFSQTEK